ncbi:DUF4192 domain-containing protein [Rhodococcus triatomae]|nr:hypothetical protein G419_01580 [Rhodococcus triatomae BKS 15-14]
MTTTQPNPLPSGPSPVRISEPGELIAALPALLGFRPRRSLVAICLGGSPTSVQCVMRQDLPDGLVSADDRFGLEQVAVVCANSGADAVVVVVVDDRDTMPSSATVPAFVDLFTALLQEVGVPVRSAHATTDIVAGRPWWGLDGDLRCGALPDPTASRVALAQVLRGRPILESRDELSRILAPLPDRRRRELGRRLAVARHPASGAVGDRELLERILVRIAVMEATGRLTDDEIVAVSVALERVRVRDAVLGLAVTVAADAAEQVWLALARGLPGRARAEASALLGFSAYVRGNGPLAGVAFAAARCADPGHRLAGLLDRALGQGLPPAEIVALAATGRDVALDLGVELPPSERR